MNFALSAENLIRVLKRYPETAASTGEAQASRFGSVNVPQTLPGPSCIGTDICGRHTLRALLVRRRTQDSNPVGEHKILGTEFECTERQRSDRAREARITELKLRL